jgi:hypothetical protein
VRRGLACGAGAAVPKTRTSDGDPQDAFRSEGVAREVPS